MNRVITLIVAAIAARLITFALFDPVSHILEGDALTFINPRPGYQPPLYPWLIGLAGWRLMPLLQTIMMIAVGLFTMYRLPRHGFATALTLVTLPWFILVEWMIRTETLVICLLWVSMLLLAFPRRSWESVVAGVGLWLTLIGRDTFLLLPLALIPFAWWAGREALKRTLLAASVACLLTIPMLPISQGRLGFNLWIGTWERSGEWMNSSMSEPPAEAFWSESERPPLLRAYRAMDERTLRESAIDRMRTQPLRVAGNWAVRYPRLWVGTRTEQGSPRLAPGSAPWTAMKLAFAALAVSLLLLGLAGMIIAPNPLFIAPIAYVAAIYVPFHNVETRFTLPALPFLIWFAMFAADGIRRRLVAAIDPA